MMPCARQARFTGIVPDGLIKLGNPSEYTVRDLAEIIIKLTGSRSI
jgi:hypothetical protein